MLHLSLDLKKAVTSYIASKLQKREMHTYSHFLSLYTGVC